MKKINSKKIDFAIGGQAVIEGVMMRSLNYIVIAVRKPNGGIKIKSKKYKTLTQKIKFLNIPILRGIINLFEMMIVGAKAINYSANESIQEPEKNIPKIENSKNSKITMKIFEVLLFIFSFVFALALALFLFKFLPLWLTTYLEGKNGYISEHYIIFNLIDGIFKISIFLLYIFLLSIIPSFRKVFEYHGAEHKSIFAYEKKKKLTIKNARPQSRFHPRCGTSFILIVFIISILVYTFVPKQQDFLTNLSVRIAFLPLIAGISYEFLKLSAKFVKNIFMKILVAPGLWLQRITTKEPDAKQLEVGLMALKEALRMEKASKLS